MRILILGGGPTGLGAASRLHGLGHADWELWEQEPVPGGLSRSVVDEHGFTWDLGGHVQFSHYKTFDEAMERALGAGGWLVHERESWIRIFGGWVPYPFQYNIHRLPKEETLRCLTGLLALKGRDRAASFQNFRELIMGCFGEGLADLFMLPYNTKVWGYPPEMLSTEWIGERVALPDLAKIAESVVMGKDQVSWGPNQTFRFAAEGGTGAIWQAIADALPQERIHYGRRAVAIDPAHKTITDQHGRETRYDALITTLPLDRLTAMGNFEGALNEQCAGLKFSNVHVIGLALEGQPGPELRNKYWMYFPEPANPFFSVTVFSNYSPGNVPDPARSWSLMAEVAETPEEPRDGELVVRETVEALVREGLIPERRMLHHTWHKWVPYAYPTPALGRDRILRRVLPALEEMGIYSRGRFGGWKYEVGNQDHSMMQGVEAVNRILLGSPELTLWFPDVVNAPHPAYGKNWL
jgi:protoporphyrinogen oxidase